MSVWLLLWSSLQLLDPPSAAAPAAPPAAPAQAPARRIDDHGRPLTGMVPQGSYEAGVRGAFVRTQSRLGPLDGGWLLKDAAGRSLYRVQLADPGGARLEGAWTDLTGGGGAAASGFFAEVERTADTLTLSFGPGMAASLTAAADGGFTGAMGAKTVTLVRP